jgi:hypothetical protein
MLPSTALGLLALLRRIRSISGNILKSFILHCLLSWPHLLRSLRYIWSLFSRRTGSPKDVLKKKGGQTRSSFPRASGVCEGYSTIYASLDFNSAGGSHLQMGPDNADDDIPLPPIPHLNPLTFTHSRITSTQFAGVPRRSRSRSPSTYPHSHSYPTLESPGPSPGHLRSPSPFLSLQPHRSPHLSVLDSPANTPIPDAMVYPPSRLQDAGADSPSIIRVPLSLPSFEEGSLSQFRTASAEHSALDPLNPGTLGLSRGNARHSTEILQPTSPHRVPDPFPHSQVTLADIPIIDAPGNWSDGKRRHIVLMHPEQVSRSMNKGTV